VSNSLPRFPHQTAATEALRDHPALILGYRPGRGKTRAVVDAACLLYAEDRIDTLLVVAPAGLRSIWGDPDPVLGEVAKWMWPGTDYTIHEYHTKTRLQALRPRGLAVVVTNYEFLRRPERLDPLIEWARGRRVLLVADESWAVQSIKAQQTKALLKLRAVCQRVVLLNGTLGAPDKQYSQFLILDKRIFDGMNWWAWRARYCKMGGFQAKAIVGFTNLDEFAARTAPYVLLNDGGDDFARVAPPVRTQIEVPLTPATWKTYTALRDEFVAWLSDTTTATALQAGVRAMRLAQVANGFVGGIEEDADLLDVCPQCADTGERATSICDCVSDKPLQIADTSTREIGDEKLRALETFLVDEGVPDKVLVFTRFRPDVERTVRRLAEAFPNHRVLPIYGSQPAEERDEAKRLLAPGGDPRKAIIVANAQSGGAGLNLAAASLCVFLGNDYALKTRVQAEGRVDRTGQTRQVRFVDFLATGPKGEKTIDHLIASTLRKKEDVVLTTLQAWSRMEDAA
jgi:SNF2 family DNA or RNA helicase